MTKAEAKKLAKEWNAKHGPGTMFTTLSGIFRQSGPAVIDDHHGDYSCYIPFLNDDGKTDFWNHRECNVLRSNQSKKPAVAATKVRDLIISDLNCFVTSIGYGPPRQKDPMIAAYFQAIESLILLRKAIFEREGK